MRFTKIFTRIRLHINHNHSLFGASKRRNKSDLQSRSNNDVQRRNDIASEIVPSPKYVRSFAAVFEDRSTSAKRHNRDRRNGFSRVQMQISLHAHLDASARASAIHPQTAIQARAHSLARSLARSRERRFAFLHLK